MKEEKCPYCGQEKFVIAKQSGYASIYPSDKFLTFKSQELYHKICLNCGTVVRSYVPNPQVLVTKK